jgi:hypothetical protein
VNTAAVHNSSAVSLFLLLVVVVTYVPASSAKRKRKGFFKWSEREKRETLFADLCTSCGTVKRLYVKDPKRDWVV